MQTPFVGVDYFIDIYSSLANHRGFSIQVVPFGCHEPKGIKVTNTQAANGESTYFPWRFFAIWSPKSTKVFHFMLVMERNLTSYWTST